jgi:hypothetical protein
MRAHWLRLIQDTEKRTDSFLVLQNQNSGSPDYGSVNTDYGYPDPKPTAFQASAALSVYLNAESRYHKDPRILAAFDAALGYMEKKQNADGTFDYTPCNFQSPPDTAFILNRTVVTYDLLQAQGTSETARFVPRIVKILEKAGHGLATGGFHTPNHRWAISACLSSIARITGNPWFASQADQYLKEGIDGNADGEYAERSAGGYNQVNNEQLLILADERKDPSFLPFVDRNLEMMLTYLDPDRSIFTANSTRQDRGQKVWLDYYFSNYLLAARALKKPLYNAVAKTIIDDCIAAGRLAPDFLDIVMVRFGGVLDYGTDLPALPTTFRKHYKDSGIVRVRNNDFGYSLLQGGSRFLYFQSGALVASVKLGVVYFEKREFKAESITQVDGAWVMKFTAKGWYYQPFPTAPATSDWWAMDHSQRPKSPGPVIDFTITVKDRPEGDGIDVRVQVEGWKGVPLRFEIALPPGPQIDGEGFIVEATAEDAVVVKSGMVRVRKGAEVLAFGPGFAEHRAIVGAYSDGRSRDHHTVYFTGSTPFDKTLTFRRAPAREGL